MIIDEIMKTIDNAMKQTVATVLSVELDDFFADCETDEEVREITEIMTMCLCKAAKRKMDKLGGLK